MHIFIMRHGEAQPLRRSDRERQLTDLGKEQAIAAGQWLHCSYFSQSHIDYALVSPYHRARQTFDYVNGQVTVKQCEFSDDVIPSGQPRLVNDYLSHLLSDVKEPYKSILVVSHMPFVSYLVDELCARHHSILFATAAIAVVEYLPDQNKATLVDHYHPS